MLRLQLERDGSMVINEVELISRELINSSIDNSWSFILQGLVVNPQ